MKKIEAIGPFIPEKIRPNSGHCFHKTRPARINGSRLISRPDPSNDDVVSFSASRNFRLWLERAKMRNDWLRSGKSPYFTLSISFHINISVKVSVRLLRNLCGNQEKFVSDQSSGSNEGRGGV